MVSLIAAVAVAVAVGGFLTVRRHQLNAELTTVRDSISFPDGWTILDERREPPALFGTTCNFGATRCPSISIELSMPFPPRVVTDLQLPQPSLRWRSENERCEVPENYSNDKAPLCSLTGQIDQWNITVRTASVADRGNLLPPHTATITIEPSD
ncbi:MAG: hypothetical protein Q4P71_01205 [Actinomycetaceae bacterium]|nr:hypothetical protein [Actinomycetaceae bacterium]